MFFMVKEYHSFKVTVNHSRVCDTSPMAGHGMVFLGFGKYVRADRIYALEPIVGEDRGSGRRTLVWVEGIPEPVVASRTQETILARPRRLTSSSRSWTP